MKVANTLLGLAQLPYLFGLFLIIGELGDPPSALRGFGIAIFFFIAAPLYSFLYCLSLGVAYIGYKVSHLPVPRKLFMIYAILPTASLLFFIYVLLN